MHYGGDETEEGEVYDGSDQEEADSDQNATSDASPRHPKFTSQGQRLPMRPGVASGYLKSDPHYRRYPIPHGPVSRPFPLSRSADHLPPIRPVHHDTGTRVYEAPENNSYDGRSQVNQHDHPHPAEPNVPYSHERVGPPPHYPLRPEVPNGPPPLPFPKPQLPGLPAPPLTAVGSQEEIERMHQMYQKACEFYERAAAKVVSAGLNLPLAVPPKPPPVSLLLPQPGPPQPAPPVRRPGDSNATNYPIVSSGDLNAPSVTKSSEAHLPPHVPQPETMVPPAPALSADRSNYSLAYAAAYKQTVGTIPPPENGGPAPNTPEYSALWQRYMDYYLRYYMQAYASMVPNGPSKPGAAINPPETTTVSPTKTSVSATTEEEKPVPPKTSQSKEDENSPALKRPKLSEKVNTEASVKTDNGKQDTASDVEVSSQTTQPAEQPTETPKATAPPPSSDDIKSSKCIWISNLPQGVKAVDVKERCTPFGRVQTIKIIGSRKSTPPSIYAYLVMESVEAATRLVEGLQGAKFDSQEIKVKRINALPIP
ncbi:hypothetical protein CSKR_110637 [Clonorchis sinensis]|uniref:RRM domain-containing protein n=1 Tax=Clonorchis sinensis TaxID=79923 RepID=A0A8T1M1H6_CLOSI|nr:hypothetical protein CSKR_110637 [Clonorchis sinensis]